MVRTQILFWYTCRGLQQGFQQCLAERLNQRLSSIGGLGLPKETSGRPRPLDKGGPGGGSKTKKYFCSLGLSLVFGLPWIRHWKQPTFCDTTT